MLLGAATVRLLLHDRDDVAEQPIPDRARVGVVAIGVGEDARAALGAERAAHVVGVFAHPDRDGFALELAGETAGRTRAGRCGRPGGGRPASTRDARRRAADRTCRRASAHRGCARQARQRRLAVDVDQIDRAPADLARRRPAGRRARDACSGRRARPPPRRAAASPGRCRARARRARAADAAARSRRRGTDTRGLPASATPIGPPMTISSWSRPTSSRHRRAGVERARLAADAARGQQRRRRAPAPRSACAAGRWRASRADHCPIAAEALQSKSSHPKPDAGSAPTPRAGAGFPRPRRRRCGTGARAVFRVADDRWPAAARCARTWCARPAEQPHAQQRGRRAPLDHLPFGLAPPAAAGRRRRGRAPPAGRPARSGAVSRPASAGGAPTTSAR